MNKDESVMEADVKNGDEPLISEEKQKRIYDFVKDEPYTDWEDHSALRNMHPLHHLKCAIKYLIEARWQFAANKGYYEGEDPHIENVERLSFQFFTRSYKTENPDTFIAEYIQSVHALIYPTTNYQVVDGRVVDETTSCPLDLYEEFRKIFDDFIHDVSFLQVPGGFVEMQEAFYRFHNTVKGLLLKGRIGLDNTLSDVEWRDLIGKFGGTAQFLVMTLGTYEMLLEKLYREGKILIAEKEAKELRHQRRKSVCHDQLRWVLETVKIEMDKSNGRTDDQVIKEALKRFPGGYASVGSLRQMLVREKDKDDEWGLRDDKRPRTRGFKYH